MKRNKQEIVKIQCFLNEGQEKMATSNYMSEYGWATIGSVTLVGMVGIVVTKKV